MFQNIYVHRMLKKFKNGTRSATNALSDLWKDESWNLGMPQSYNVNEEVSASVELVSKILLVLHAARQWAAIASKRLRQD